MRLWHIDLIPLLDDKRLLSQHRECCMFRGKRFQFGNYPGILKTDNIENLLAYHFKVTMEMSKRGFNVNLDWLDPYYRGESLPEWKNVDLLKVIYLQKHPEEILKDTMTDSYKTECIKLIKSRGGVLKNA
jgi:uncharacterized protein (TIGR02328 family)